MTRPVIVPCDCKRTNPHRHLFYPHKIPEAITDRPLRWSDCDRETKRRVIIYMQFFIHAWKGWPPNIYAHLPPPGQGLDYDDLPWIAILNTTPRLCRWLSVVERMFRRYDRWRDRLRVRWSIWRERGGPHA